MFWLTASDTCRCWHSDGFHDDGLYVDGFRRDGRRGIPVKIQAVKTVSAFGTILRLGTSIENLLTGSGSSSLSLNSTEDKSFILNPLFSGSGDVVFLREYR